MWTQKWSRILAPKMEPDSGPKIGAISEPEFGATSTTQCGFRPPPFGSGRALACISSSGMSSLVRILPWRAPQRLRHRRAQALAWPSALVPR